MAARPWMPFYFGDYLADTGHLTTLEHGSYLLLIAHYWMKGGLPAEDAQLARIARVTMAQWQRMKPTLRSFFSDDWKHKRIEFEMTEAARIAEAGRAGGKASAENRKANKSLKNNNHTSTTVERPCNDQGNDPATISQALQPQPQYKSARGENDADPPQSPLVGEDAISVARALLESVGLTFDDPRSSSLSYSVQGWLNTGCTKEFILARGAEVISRKNKIPHMNYLDSAIRNGWAEHLEKPTALAKGTAHATVVAGQNKPGWQSARDDFRAARADLKAGIAAAERRRAGGGEGGG